MPTWNDTTIVRFAEEAEKNFCIKHKLIVDRVSLAISAGVDELTIPAYIFEIRRVTHKGKTLDPFGQYEYIESGTTPYIVTGGIPKFYIVNYRAKNKLRILPTPSEDIPLQSTSLWEETAIRDGFIIEFYRIPDFTTSTHRMLSFMRRQYIKNYVIQRCSGMEGRGNNEKDSLYFDQKMELSDGEISSIKSNIFSCMQNVMEPLVDIPRKPGRPVLPTNFGTVI